MIQYSFTTFRKDSKFNKENHRRTRLQTKKDKLLYFNKKTLQKVIGQQKEEENIRFRRLNKRLEKKKRKDPKEKVFEKKKLSK